MLETTARVKGDSAIDNQDQMSVSCTVKDNSGTFAVSATLKSPATKPDPNDPTTTVTANPTEATVSPRSRL